MYACELRSDGKHGIASGAGRGRLASTMQPSNAASASETCAPSEALLSESLSPKPQFQTVLLPVSGTCPQT